MGGVAGGGGGQDTSSRDLLILLVVTAIITITAGFWLGTAAALGITRPQLQYRLKKKEGA